MVIALSVVFLGGIIVWYVTRAMKGDGKPGCSCESGFSGGSASCSGCSSCPACALNDDSDSHK